MAEAIAMRLFGGLIYQSRSGHGTLINEVETGQFAVLSVRLVRA